MERNSLQKNDKDAGFERATDWKCNELQQS